MSLHPSLCGTTHWCDCPYIRCCVVHYIGKVVTTSVLVWYGRLVWLFLHLLLCGTVYMRRPVWLFLHALLCGTVYADRFGCSYIRCCVVLQTGVAVPTSVVVWYCRQVWLFLHPLFVIQQIGVDRPARDGHWRRSAQPVPDDLLAARRHRLPQLLLQLLRLLRHGVTLPGHAVGAAGKEGEESNDQGSCRDQRN